MRGKRHCGSLQALWKTTNLAAYERGAELTMYKIVYPENGQEVVSIEFIWMKDATDYWRNKYGTLWVEIKPQHPDDIIAFMQPITGEVVVVRRFEAA